MIKDIIKNFTEFLTSLSGPKRVAVIATLIAIGCTITGLFIWAGQTHYKTLYSNLTTEDSALISQILEEGKIPYLVEDEGKTLKIPDDKVEVLRLEIAKRGVSFQTTLGYEVFDKQAFGTTNFVQKVNRQRAIEGELVKTITHLKGVIRARVHLSLPESSPFVSEKKNPTASVVLDVRPGYTMSSDEIKGISHLVSAAIEGMRPEFVVVLDTGGKKLSENVSDSMTAETANRVALEASMNSKYEKQVEEILSRVVGSGKIVAKVSVNLDYTEKLETETTYDGENSAIVSEVSNTQKFQGARPSPQGVPGAKSNVPGENPQPQTPMTTSDTDKNLVTKNYHVPSKVTQAKKPAAEIKAVNVAVMVDGKRVPLLDASGKPVLDTQGLPKTKYEAWTESELQNFSEIVSSSLGIKPERGDKIVMKNMEFAQEDMSHAENWMAKQQQAEFIRNLVKYVVIGIIVSLFFILIVRPFIQWITDNSVDSIEDFLPKTLLELESLQANQKLPGLEDSLPAIEERLNPDKVESNLLKDKVVGLIEQNPMKAAQVVTGMIHTMEESKSNAAA
ncbi:MAG: flagellar basal-body MS-ring/collar protein FliF [Bacteriovoracaceae bacterium]|nr:flagellar basal-body MS-ring/collar protein FliF [Bacteriovoracaceae bacterium]